MKKLATMTLLISFCIFIGAAPSTAGTAKEQTGQPSQKNFSQYLDNIDMVSVPGGCFQMGSDSGIFYEQPTHEVCVDSFRIGRHEVTQGLWQAVMGSNPSHFQLGADHPVEMVSWQDTQVFLEKLNQLTGRNYRLPTEAEWEYACLSGGKKDEKFCGGNDPDEIAWYDNKGGEKTKKVGAKKPNGFGIYDMSGNVEEWVSDWFGHYYYASSPKDNPIGPTVEPGKNYGHTIRGGIWSCGDGVLRAKKRQMGGKNERRAYDLGFRLVHTE